MRLANLITAPPTELLLEDAIELASWRTRPPLLVIEGRIVASQSLVPPLGEWLAANEEPADGG